MKVLVTKIELEKEELATLQVHEYGEDIRELTRYIRAENYRSIVIMCNLNGGLYPVQTNHIVFIEASPDEKLMVHTESLTYDIKKRLYELESILPSNFIRISKSIIMNMDRVKLYKPMLNGLMQIQFQNGDTAYISRKYLKEVRNKIMEVQHEERKNSEQ